MTDLPGINNQVIVLARDWLGTPYKHQASLKGVGCDCIGLIIGIWRELYGRFPKGFKMPPYTAHWAEETQRSLMVDIGSKYLQPVNIKDMVPGDIIMYRMLRRGQTKHTGIYSAETNGGKMIHAYMGHDVMETGLITNAGAKLTHVFRFPVQLED